MGYAIAQVATDMGAKVTLVSGHSALPVPDNLAFIRALNANSMYQAVMQQVAQQDVFIAVAAVADYSPAQISPQKIKKVKTHLRLTL